LARRLVALYGGPNIPDLLAYPTNTTITVDTAPPAGPSGPAFSLVGKLGSDTGFLGSPNIEPTYTVPSGIVWVVGRWWRTNHTPTGTDQVGIISTGGAAGTAQYFTMKNDGGAWRFKVYTQIGGTLLASSINTFSANTWLGFRFQWDGSRFIAWIDSGSGFVEEVNFAHTLKKNTAGASFAAQTGVAGKTRWWRDWAMFVGDDGPDRPDRNVDTAMLAPNQNSAADDGTYNDYTPIGTGSWRYDRWDDWASGANDGDTTYLRGDSAEAGTQRQSSNLTTYTFTGTIHGVRVHVLMRENVAGKGIIVYVTTRSGGVDYEVSVGPAGWIYDTYQPGLVLFSDGTGYGPASWAQSDIDALEAGSRRDPLNPDAHIFATAMAVEGCSVGNDPGPSLYRVPGLRLPRQAVSRASRW